MGKMMLIDTSRCISCRACQVACKMWHALPPEENNEPRTDLTGTTLTIVKESEAEVGGKIRRLFFKDQCRHCEDPWCIKACPRDAIKKLSNGAIKIRGYLCKPNKCTVGEPKSCQAACPYNIPRIDTAKNKATKCNLCHDRYMDGSGRKTACADACPTGAIFFGKDTKVLEEANKRLAKLKTRYPNANIGGAPDGPSHVIWLFTEDHALYGL